MTPRKSSKNKPGKRKATPRRINADERAAKALDLRKQGLTYREIGKRIRCTTQNAWACVQKALAELRDKTSETAQDVRDQQLGRLDAALKALWPKIKRGEPRAIDTAIRLEERRSKLLGLDAPSKQEVSGPDGGAIPIEDARAMLASRLAAIAGEPESSAAASGTGEPS